MSYLSVLKAEYKELAKDQEIVRDSITLWLKRSHKAIDMCSTLVDDEFYFSDKIDNLSANDTNTPEYRDLVRDLAITRDYVTLWKFRRDRAIEMCDTVTENNL